MKSSYADCSSCCYCLCCFSVLSNQLNKAMNWIMTFLFSDLLISIKGGVVITVPIVRPFSKALRPNLNGIMREKAWFGKKRLLF